MSEDIDMSSQLSHWRGEFGDAYRDFAERLADKTPLKRVGRPEELCGAVLFLASETASYVTGTNIVLNGGWTAG